MSSRRSFVRRPEHRVERPAARLRPELDNLRQRVRDPLRETSAGQILCDIQEHRTGCSLTYVSVQMGHNLKVSSIASDGSDTEIFDLHGRLATCSNGAGRAPWSCKSIVTSFDPASTPSAALDANQTLHRLGRATHLAITTPRVAAGLALHCLQGSTATEEISICLDPRGIVGFAQVGSTGHSVTLSLAELHSSVPSGQFLLPAVPTSG